MKSSARYFSTQVFGKFILAGEHTVLRGGPALVFPLRSRHLSLEYFWGGNALENEPLYNEIIERALNLSKHTRDDIHGAMKIRNIIPVGSGLGASAALCVAIARLFEELNLIRRSELQNFARQLEDLYHGESSGVDIAVAINECGIHYERSGSTYPLTIPGDKFRNQFYLSHSGHHGKTADCVQKVKTLIETNPEKAKKIDVQMIQATSLIEGALKDKSSTSHETVIEGLNLARDCFDQWDLTKGQLQSHMDQLLEAGASAVKPTGSGGGGYLLSFWEDSPPAVLNEKLISASLI